jgi:hypothetical protein
MAKAVTSNAEGRQAPEVWESLPIRWTLAPAEKLATITAEGVCTLTDLEAMFDALVVAEASGWRKLFDARAGEARGVPEDLMMLGARMRAYAGVLSHGPLAIVVSTPYLHELALRYLNLARADRPAEVFETPESARIWLASFAK